jgi:quercetin dioxygenase-like cupin family protein
VLVFKLEQEQQWDADRHVEKILGKIGAGDVTVACWEPGQVSPYHCHPEATEIYFCFSGGGVMRTPEQTVDITPGSFVVHPSGELHEYANGAHRTMLFRVRYGRDMRAHFHDWRSNAAWRQSAEDSAYFRDHPQSVTAGSDKY